MEIWGNDHNWFVLLLLAEVGNVVNVVMKQWQILYFAKMTCFGMFICELKTHITQKQMCQMLFFLGQKEHLGQDVAIGDAKDDIIFLWERTCMC